MTKILVVYATKHHSTAEIAIRIGKVLQQSSKLQVDIQSVERVEFIAGYDAIVMGSAVYNGNWRPQASEFLQLHAQELAQIPLWLFSSGPTGEGEANDLLKGWEFPAALRVLAYQIQPRSI